MRIWHQSVTELDRLGPYREGLVAHAQAALGDAVTVDVHGLSAGAYRGRTPTSALANAYVAHRLLGEVVENALRAEAEGYDAFVIGSFSDPMLREARSAVDIPIVSLVESALLVGCSLGKGLALISNADPVVWMTRLAVEKHALGARVLEVTGLEPSLEEDALAAAYSAPKPVLDAFETAARAAVRRGADVIIPAEGVLAELLHQTQVTRIDDAVVLDVFAAAWNHARMMVDLRVRSGVAVSRAWHFRRDDPDLLSVLSLA